MLWTVQVSMVPPNQSLKCNFFQKKRYSLSKTMTYASYFGRAWFSRPGRVFDAAYEGAWT